MVSQPSAQPDRASGYAWYVLIVLFLVYILNFVDRQILAILAEDIKADLNLTDDDIGFLYGTAFGVFYSLFGIPLGRLADSWQRGRLLAVGLALWSTMTTLSGFARNGAELTIARIGVGVGEATASPSAYSLISDWFPRRLRATALAIYSSGIYIGGGFSLFIGGLIVRNWNMAWPDGGPLGLVGWQAAFLAVGLPGLVLALWMLTLREPVRGASEGIVTPPHPAPFRAFLTDLGTILPPFTLIGAARGGARALIANLLVLAAVIAAVAALVSVGEKLAQWAAVGGGIYALYSWQASLRRRDLPTWRLIVGTPAFLCVVVAYGLNAFSAYAIAAFAPSYVRRVFEVTPDMAGLWIGGGGALGGFLGVTLGGRVADKLRETNPSGRIAVILFGAVAPIVPVVIAFTTTSLTLVYAMLPIAQMLCSVALGAAAATTQDLVLPRMRGTATAAFFIGTTLIGLALGPYMAGRVSTLTGDLATGILSVLLTVPIALVAGILAYRLVPAAEASREARARAAGEAI